MAPIAIRNRQSAMRRLAYAVFGIGETFSKPNTRCRNCGKEITLANEGIAKDNYGVERTVYSGLPRYCPKCGWAGGIFAGGPLTND